MRYSGLFTNTLKNPPHDADSFNAKFLIQGGFIDMVAAGIYSYLPLGVRVLHKISRIIREELNDIGGQEILMPALHPEKYWIATGRDQSCKDILYKTEGHGNMSFYLGQSHEEIITPLAKKFVNSYRDLPFAPYQIQNKFRNEPRAKSGILRGREFLMKDMYSFHEDEEDLDGFYQLVINSYLKIFRRCGLNAFVVKASGGTFSDKHSDEFQILTNAGEDVIFYSEKLGLGFNSEVIDIENPMYEGEILTRGKAVEAGNIFKLGTKFSEDFDLYYTDKNGAKKPVYMGCYGIGVSRLLGTIVEASHDNNGIIWPMNVSPFQIHLLNLGSSSDILEKTDELYHLLIDNNFEVLFDDRDERAGIKLHDADLIGIPIRIVIGGRCMNDGMAELKLRSSNEIKLIPYSRLIDELEFIVNE